MKLLVCGSRDWDDRITLGIVLRGFLHKTDGALEIIEGCARGADEMAEAFAKHFGLVTHHFPAQWDDYAPSERWRAGHDRNQAMLDFGPDMVVAFKNGLDPKLARGGTENMVKIARDAGVRVMHVEAWR